MGYEARVEAFLTAARLVAPLDACSAAHLFDRAVDLSADEGRGRQSILVESLPPLIWSGRSRDARDVARELLRNGTEAALTGELETLLCQACLLQSEWAEALEAAKRALDIPTLTSEQRWLAKAEASFSLAGSVRIPEAEDLAEAVLRGPEDELTPLTRCVALQALALGAHFKGDAKAAIEHSDMSLLYHSPADVDVCRRLPHFLRGVHLGAADRFDEAEESLETALTLSSEYGARWALPAISYHKAYLHYRRGQWDAAVDQLDLGIDLSGRVQTTWELVNLHGMSSFIATRRGDVERGERLLSDMEMVDEKHPVAQIWWSWCMALQLEGKGQSKLALRTLSEAWREFSVRGATGAIRNSAPDLLRLARDGQDDDSANMLVTDLRATAEGSSVGLGRAFVDHCRGVLEGDIASVERAVAAYDHVQQRLHAGLAMEDIATIQAQRSNKGESLAALKDALSRYAELGADLDAKRARARLRGLGISTPPSWRGQDGATHPWSALTETERTVASLVARGMRNKDIARHLFVSVNTVQTHLKHIFKKLDVRSRVELVIETAPHVKGGEEVREPG